MFPKHLFLLVTLYIISHCAEVYSQEPIVNTTQGLVRGYKATDGDYYAYTGIPYAEIDRRNPFGATNSPPTFEEIFEANEDTYVCPQVEEFNNTLVGDLDCLRLNVFVPDVNSTDLLPVLVWIYGGRFSIGFNRAMLYGPKFLVRHDIIVVTLNYRLGPYGFMCLDIPEVPGNQGFKDQLNALKWVHANIEAFGGDPSKITIAGNSAGGMSVDFQLIRQTDEKIIDKGILQSGTSFSPSFEQPDKDAPLMLAQHLNLTTTDLTEALDFLAAQEPITLIQATEDLNLAFRPCIEKSFEGVEPFITDNWLKLEEIPLVKDMPIMMGFNNHETYIMYLSYAFNYTVKQLLSDTFDVDDDDFEGMDDIARQFFYGDEESSMDNYEPGVFLGSDMTFIYPTMRSLKRFLLNSAEKVYLYMFCYVGGRNFVQRRNNATGFGAWHADEIGYLFDMFLMDEPTERDQVMVDRMTEMWANFVKYGDPTPETSNLLPVKWESITNNSNYNYLNIDWEMEAGTGVLHERMTFWDLFFEANEHLQRFLIENAVDISEQMLRILFPY